MPESSCVRRTPAVHAGTLPGVDLMTKFSSIADQIESIGHALSANQLAEILGISHETVFKQARSGRIPSFRIGTCVRFDPFVIARWLRKR